MWVLSAPAESPAVESIAGVAGVVRGPARNGWRLLCVNEGTATISDGAQIRVLLPGTPANLDAVLTAGQANAMNNLASSLLAIPNFGATAGMTRLEVLNRMTVPERAARVVNDLMSAGLPATITRGQYAARIDRIDVIGVGKTLEVSGDVSKNGVSIPISWPVQIVNPPLLSPDPNGTDILGDGRLLIRSARAAIIDTLEMLVKQIGDYAPTPPGTPGPGRGG